VLLARCIKCIIPGSSLHIIPQAGHFLMEDKPNEISEIIETFICKKNGLSMESNNSLSVSSDAYFYIDSQGEFLYGFPQQSKPLSLHFTHYD
jgi:hypothetical protein